MIWQMRWHLAKLYSAHKSVCWKVALNLTGVSYEIWHARWHLPKFRNEGIYLLLAGLKRACARAGAVLMVCATLKARGVKEASVLNLGSLHADLPKRASQTGEARCPSVATCDGIARLGLLKVCSSSGRSPRVISGMCTRPIA